MLTSLLRCAGEVALRLVVLTNWASWYKGQLCGGDGTGQCGGSDREEDEREAESCHWQPLSSSMCQAEKVQENTQPRASKHLWGSCHQPHNATPPRISNLCWLRLTLRMYIHIDLLILSASLILFVLLCQIEFPPWESIKVHLILS